MINFIGFIIATAIVVTLVSMAIPLTLAGVGIFVIWCIIKSAQVKKSGTDDR